LSSEEEEEVEEVEETENEQSKNFDEITNERKSGIENNRKMQDNNN
jgi:hypothetical protein